MAVAAITALTAAGCGPGTVEVKQGFFGSLAVEEPRAALLARDVLAAGGSAADAAVIAYFALAVTLPSSAGLGATGSCVVFDPIAGPRFERLDFYPAPASGQGPTAALPIGPRAMFALHARYGRTKFEELLIAAERLARFGEPVSRALAAELSAFGGVLRNDPQASRIFLPQGRPLAQQDLLTQIDLAATLGRLRGEGIGSLYTGTLAKEFIEAAARAGVSIDPDRLRDRLPSWSTVSGLVHDNHLWAVAAPDLGDTALSEVALAMGLHASGWAGREAAARHHVLAEIMSRASAKVLSGTRSLDAEAAEAAMAGLDADRRTAGVPAAQLAATLGSRALDVAGSTAFYMVDRSGMTVGCAIGLGAPFGVARVAPGFGVLLGQPQTARGDGPGAAALVVGNTNAKQMHLAMAASGGRPAISALLSVALDHWELRQRLDEAVAGPRSHLAGGSDTLAVEPALPPEQRRRLEATGYKLGDRPGLGRVNGFRCVEGIPRRDMRCEMGVDPRSRGLGFFERGK